MTPIPPLSPDLLASLRTDAKDGWNIALALLHLIDRADQRDQDVAVFVDSYSSTIAALCRRLEALERGAKDPPTHHRGPTMTTDSSRAATLLQQQEAELAALRGVPVAWCLSDEFENAMKRGGSFNGWKDPGAGANKCDMRLYAIPLPAPQAGEVEA